MKKIQKWILGFLFICILGIFAFWGLIKYYQIKIPFGTWVNSIYCTGKTYEEAAEELLVENTYIPTLDVVDVDGKVHTLKLPIDTYLLTYRIGLEDAIIKEGIFSEKHIQLEPKVVLDTAKYNDYISTLTLFQPVTVLSGNDRLEIVKKDDGFHLLDRFKYVLNIEKTLAVIQNAFEQNEKQVNLLDAGCYETPAYLEADNAIKDTYIKLLEFCNTFFMELTIEGEIAYTVDTSVLKDWILTKKDGSYALDKEGNYQLDKSKVKEYAQQINKETTTYFGKAWEFTNHNGIVVEVKAGNYGRALKTNALYNVLLNGFKQGNQARLAYELEFNFYPKTAKDIACGAGIGDSYIEVDIDAQEIYMYLDGELVFTSDCVTGDVWRHRETPKGVFYVEYKQRNRVLVGEDYRTPVSYWMHFYNHCGFHDASWRKAFGDDIYLRDGSHGCINMPPAKAKEMYELAFKGMPVVVY